MPTWLPFRALRYNPAKAPDLAVVLTPPFDVISPAAQQAYAASSPYNSINLILGRSRPDDGPGGWYARAAHDLQSWQEQDVLVRDPDPALYVLRQAFSAPGPGEPKQYTRTGIIARLKLAPWGSGILPHERTFPNAKADRLALTEATRAQYNPVFTLFSDPENDVIRSLEARLAEKAAVTWQADGVENSLWIVTDPATIRAVTQQLDPRTLYVADGHHRYETALNYQRQRRQAEEGCGSGAAAYDYVLAYATPMQDPGVMILPTHRVVHDLGHFAAQPFINGLYDRFSVVPYQSGQQLQQALKQAPPGEHRFGLVLADRAESALLIGRPEIGSVPELAEDHPTVAALDVAVLHRLILTPLLGVPVDPQQQKQVLFFTPDPEEAIDIVRRGQGQAAFLINATPIQALAEVAEAGQVMPPKSTYFYPKLPSALVIHSLS